MKLQNELHVLRDEIKEFNGFYCNIMRQSSAF